VTPGQCRAARALLDWTQIDLAKTAGVGQWTVSNFERSKLVAAESITKMRLALEDAGIKFTDGKRPGVRMKGVIAKKRSVIPRPKGKPRI
jgi:DNA-binding XRE family transcriptional regulator